MKPICIHKPTLMRNHISIHNLCKRSVPYLGIGSINRRSTRLNHSTRIKAGAHCLLLLAVALTMLPSFAFLLNNANAHTPNTTVIRILPESEIRPGVESRTSIDAEDAEPNTVTDTESGFHSNTEDTEDAQAPLLVEVEFEVIQMARLLGIESSGTAFPTPSYLEDLKVTYADEIANYITTNLRITNQSGALIELKRYDSQSNADVRDSEDNTGIRTHLGSEGQWLFALTLEPLTELRGEIISLSYDSLLDAISGHTISVLASAPADDAQDDGSGTVVSYPSTVDSSSVAVAPSTEAPEVHLKLAGILSSDTRSITVDLSNPALPFWSLIVEGYEHVLEGLDHLLFVLLLAIPAPLVITAGKWSSESEGGVLRTFIRILHVLTAFTVGHTITLIAAARGWVDLPSTLTETTIAVSVAVGAVHLIRPIPFFHSRAEPAIAVLFGLIHGLAFAGLLDGIGIGAERAIGDLLAFNIGVELAQILTVVIIFPAIVLLALSFGWFLVRVAVAVLSLLIACGWVLERLTEIDSPLGPVEDAMLKNQVALVLLLNLLSGIAYAVTMSTRLHTKFSKTRNSSV